MTTLGGFPLFKQYVETRNAGHRSGLSGGFRPPLALALAVVLMSLSLERPLSAFAPDAKDVLSRAQAAMGGDAWDKVRVIHLRAVVAAGGLQGPSESWEDVITGAYVDRFQLGPASGAEGFDGKTAWSQDSSKQVTRQDGGETLEAAVNEAFRRSLSYWFPQRLAGKVEVGDEVEEGGSRYIVLRMTPAGGRPFDIWVDGQTYFFDRIVEKGGLETRTTFFSEYRAIDGVKIPFRQRSTNGDVKYDQSLSVEAVEINPPNDASLFRIPEPPPPDFSIAGKKTSVNLPFNLLNNHIYLEVKLNGQGPFLFLFDTGGANVIVPRLVEKLHLTATGALQGRGAGEKSEDVALTTIDKLELGDISISNQIFYVLAFDGLENVEGVAFDGLIGFEVLKRFTVQVDYERSRLTFVVPEAFEHKGEGTGVPFTFNERIPEVEGEIDGLTGKFTIDTGSRASLDLHAPFVEKHVLRAKYEPNFEAMSGWGVGGGVRSTIVRARQLKLGDVVVPSPVMGFSLQKKGSSTDTYVAGNVGAGVLKRFNVTFDYARQRIIFGKNKNYGLPDVYDRSGMWINLHGDQFEVLDVVAGGPANQAGIRVGDRVLAMDGKSTAEWTLPGARLKLRSDPPGTQVRLKVRTGQETRDVLLTLRDLI